MEQKRLNRQSHRYYGYDYSQEGLYFITICTKNNVCLFGEIIHEEVYLSAIGKIVQDFWLQIIDYHPYVVLHEFVIMPNHIHGIIEITKKDDTDEIDNSNCKIDFASPSKTIGSIIRGFKIGVSSWVTKNIGIRNIWHRNYHDHVIRNYEAYINIKLYILNNPKNWGKDKGF
jgi:REP element-mobilizing transposase RayT